MITGEPFYKLIQGDCLEVLPTLASKSVDCIIADLPYNIKADTWDSIKDYVDWLKVIFKEFQRVLKDNGSLYWFHSEMPIIAELMVWIDKETRFLFNRFIVWNKRFNGSKTKGYLDGYVVVENLNNYQQMAEYLLYYTVGTIEKSCKTTIMANYLLKEIQRAKQLKPELTNQIISQIFKQAKGYNCISNWCLNYNIPSKSQYEKLRLYLNSTVANGFLEREYTDLVPVFNNQKSHHSVWNYEYSLNNGHATPKPVELIETILKHSTNPGNVVLDPTAGTGTTIKACKNLGRSCIAIEQAKKYADKIQGAIINQTSLYPFSEARF